jgi:hypothetical protein
VARWLGLVDDAEPGGSTLDALADPGPVAIPAPDYFIPVTAANADPGLRNLDRDNEVRGRRGNVAPVAFASAPSLTFEARAYPLLLRRIIPAALGGAPVDTGVAPAAITSTVEPLESGALPAMHATLVREEQTDRLAGLVIEEFELNLPADEEGTLSVTAQGLYHEPAATSSPPSPTYLGHEDAFMLRDVVAFTGDGAGVRIDCLGGFGLTWNNGLVDDFRSRFCAGENVRDFLVGGLRQRLWYPGRHKLGPQAITGRLDFGTTRPDLEERRLVLAAEKLVVELSAGPLGTTPDADEMLRLTVWKHALTGGGAEALAREGDITSSYEFTGYLDPASGKDLTAAFVGDAGL